MSGTEPLETRRSMLPLRGVAAHRGGPAERPENTLAAFRQAVARGVHQIEFDVRRTGDGELVVIHDASVDRTTNGRGDVGDFTLAELRRLDAGRAWGVGYPDERIPTLAEALGVLPHDLWINVQIKRRESIAEQVARTIVRAGRVHQAILTGGNQACHLAQAVDAGILVCNLARQRTRAAYLNHAIKRGASFIQFHYLRGPLERADLERAHAAGLRINFFCAPGVGQDALRRLFESGVDFVLVDDVAPGLAAAGDVGIKPLEREAL
jgi:glycerophosphoryl diester phosphodiesterase